MRATLGQRQIRQSPGLALNAHSGNEWGKIPVLTGECDEAVKNRKAAEKVILRTKELDDQAKYQEMKGKAQRIIKQAQKDYWEGYCNTLTNDSKLSSVWKMAKRMSGTNSKYGIPNLTENDQIVETSLDKANLLGKVLAKTSSDENYTASFRMRKTAMELKWKSKSTPNDTLGEINEIFNMQELQAAIKQSKKKSSPGADNISYEMIRYLPKSSLVIFLDLYNKLWLNGQTIPEWNEAIVLPIIIPGTDASNPQSYRPISLSPVLCKIMERMITNRLVWYLEKNNLFNDAQSGYKKARSTLDQLSRLHDSVKKSINNKRVYCWNFLGF